MGTWTQWLRQPQRVWLRRAAFQIHLWVGLFIGLYVVVLSLTGSLLVYRNELDRYLATPHATFDEKARAMNADELRSTAQKAYPGWQVTDVAEGRTVRRPPRAGGPGDGRGGRGRGNRLPDPTATITLERNGEKKERLFNPYNGQDLGDNTTRGQFFIMWTVRLHDVVERAPQPCVHRARVDRRGRLVAGRQPLEAQPRHQVERRLAASELGPAQRAGVLAVPVHADVGCLRLVSRHAGAADEFRGAILRSEWRLRGAVWRRRADVAVAPALRPLARSRLGTMVEGRMGGGRPRAGDHARDGRHHVVEPQGPPPRGTQCARGGRGVNHR